MTDELKSKIEKAMFNFEEILSAVSNEIQISAQINDKERKNELETYKQEVKSKEDSINEIKFELKQLVQETEKVANEVESVIRHNMTEEEDQQMLG